MVVRWVDPRDEHVGTPVSSYWRRTRRLTDDERNLMWSLRFEPCSGDDTCDPELTYHTDGCPMKEEEEEEG